MEPRSIMKSLVHFAEREYRDKRPKSVKLYRVKSKNILTRGVLSSFKIKELGYIRYLIIADYDDNLRIYSFSRQGKFLSGINVSPNLIFFKKIEKYTKLEVQFPKKTFKK